MRDRTFASSRMLIYLVVSAVALGLAGLIIALAGIILHTVVRRFQEIEHMLQIRADELRRVQLSVADEVRSSDGL